MITNTTTSLVRMLLTAIGAFVFVMFMAVQPVAAQSNFELEGGSNRSFSIGDWVETTDILKVRDAAGVLLGTQPAFALGRIINGPRTAQGYTYWEIDFQSGFDGWSAAPWLRSSDQRNQGGSSSSRGDDNVVSSFSIQELLALIANLQAQIADRQGGGGGGSSSNDEHYRVFQEDSRLSAGSEDQPVATIEIDDRSEVRYINKVDVEFINEDGDSEVIDSFSEISVWVEGSKIYEIDVDDVRWRDDGVDMRTRQKGTIFDSDNFGFGIPVPANREIDAVIAVSVSDDAVSEDWTFLIANNGIEVSSRSNGDFILGDNDTDAVRFSILQGDGDGDSLFVKASIEDPDSTTFQMDRDDNTEYVVFAFELDAEDSQNDIEVTEIYVDFEVENVKDGTDLTDLTDEAGLIMDGERVRLDGVMVDDDGIEFTIDTGDLIVEAGETVDVEVLVEFEEFSAIEGTTIQASLNGRNVEAEGDDEFRASGSATGDEHTLRTAGILTELVSTDEGLEQSMEDLSTQGIFTMEFEVTAFESDVYINPTTRRDGGGSQGTEGFTFNLRDGAKGLDNFTGSAIASIVSTADQERSGRYRIDEGETEAFELVVWYSPERTGTYQMQLFSINYNTVDANPNQHVRPIDSEDFETDHVLIDGDVDQDPASIRVTTPNGGEEFLIGRTHTIRWSPYDYNPDINAAGDVDVYLERKRGSRYITIGKLKDNGKASLHTRWEVGSYGNYADPGEYYVRAVNRITGASDRSDGSFTLVDPAADSSIEIVSLDGYNVVPGERNTYQVTFSGIERISVALYKNGKWLQWITRDRRVGNSSNNTGKYAGTWTLSNEQYDDLKSGDSFQLYVTGRLVNNGGYIDDKSPKIVALEDNSDPAPIGCEVVTDKRSYAYGDRIRVSWKGVNANTMQFVADRSGKDSIRVPNGTRRANGSAVLTANVSGSPTITMRATGNGGTADCTVRISVAQEEVDEEQTSRTHPLGSTVETTRSVFARVEPFGRSQATQPRGTKGTIVSGEVPLRGFNWIRVEYETGVTGWSAKRFLNVVTNDEPEDGGGDVNSGDTGRPVLGTYQVYIDGRLAVTARNVSRDYATNSCKSGEKDSTKSYRCTWNGIEVYKTEATTAVSVPTKPKGNSSLPAQTRLAYNCNTAGDQMTITWNMPRGYSETYFRMRDKSDGKNMNWGTLSRTSKTVSVEPGQSYDVWTHVKEDGSGDWGKRAALWNIKCDEPKTVATTVESKPAVKATSDKTLPKPTRQMHVCRNEGTRMIMRWGAPTGYDSFYFRMRESDSKKRMNWEENHSKTFMRVDVEPGKEYDWWVHTRDGATGNWSNHVGEYGISCSGSVRGASISQTELRQEINERLDDVKDRLETLLR